MRNVLRASHTSYGHTCPSRVHQTLYRNLKVTWRRAWQPTPVFWPEELPWTEEPGRAAVQSMGSQRIGHNWAAKHTKWRRCAIAANLMRSRRLMLGRRNESHLWRVWLNWEKIEKSKVRWTMRHNHGTYGFITNGNVYFHIWNCLIFSSLVPSVSAIWKVKLVRVDCLFHHCIPAFLC